MTTNATVDSIHEAEIHEAVVRLAATVDRMLATLTAQISDVVDEVKQQ